MSKKKYDVQSMGKEQFLEMFCDSDNEAEPETDDEEPFPQDDLAGNFHAVNMSS